MFTPEQIQDTTAKKRDLKRAEAVRAHLRR